MLIGDLVLNYNFFKDGQKNLNEQLKNLKEKDFIKIKSVSLGVSFLADITEEFFNSTTFQSFNLDHNESTHIALDILVGYCSLCVARYSSRCANKNDFITHFKYRLDAAINQMVEMMS